MKGTKLTAALAVLVVLVLAGIGYEVYHKGYFGLGSSAVLKDSGSNISDFSAVFLTNGQVYFGKVNTYNSQEVDISDIYYLQVNQSSSLTNGTSSTSNTSGSNSSTSNNVSLVNFIGY